MRSIALFFLFILFCTPLVAETEWTVLVYLAADNSLSQQSFKDINEMEAVEDNDSVQYLIQIDPYDDLNHPPYFTTSRRYLIRHDNNPDSIGSIMLNDLGEINSADPDEVSEFANWGFSNYPSERRMLILWDHGNGWTKDHETTKYICYDIDTGDNISVANGELKQAISNINFHLDILAFDACLMQMPEVIGEIYECCDFVIGSEEVVPEDGFPYGDITYHLDGIFDYLVENPTCTPEEFSNEIVTRYIDSYLYGGSQATEDNISLSAIKNEYFPEFQNKLFSFTSEYSDTLNNYIYENVRLSSHSFNYNSTIDIYQFFTKLNNYPEFQEIAEEILSVVDSLTVKSLAVYDNYVVPDIGRMSIYFSLYSFNSSTWQKYFQLSFVKETRWDRFLDFYFNDDSESPEILEFDISTQGNLVYFFWDAIDPSFIKYTIEYNPDHDNLYIPIHDSTYIYSHNYTTTLHSGTFNFILKAIDEFENKSCVWKTAIISDEPVFKFFPNPYIVNEDNIGKFLISNEELTDSAIYIFNLAGELVDKITIDNTIEQTIEVTYTPPNVSSGIYFCLLKAGDTIATIKLAVIR